MRDLPTPADISGIWVISGPVSPTCVFVQNGNSFRGSCEGPGAKGGVFGVVDGQTIRWSYQWTSKTDGSVGAFEFVGVLGADGNMTGSMIGTTRAHGSFTAKKAGNLSNAEKPN